MNDEDFYDDSQIGLEVNGKRWAGRNYGFQSEESYNKLFVQGKLNPAQQAIDRATSSVANLPGIKQGLQFIGGATKFVYQQLPKPVQQAAEFVAAKNQEAAENIAAATGLPVALTDPTTIADVVTGGATLAAKPAVKTALRETVEGAANLGRNLPPPGGAPQLATAGVGGPQLSMRGGGVNLQPPTVMKATTSPEWTAKGMGQDVAKTPKYAPAVKIYTDRRKAYSDKVKELQQSFEGGEINAERLKKTLAKVEKIRKGDVSTFEYDPKSPYAYKEGIESAYSPYLSTPEYQGLRSEAPRGIVSKRGKAVQTDDPFEIGRKAQQHHILAKAETKPFADTLNKLIDQGIGDPDDLVNFFVWPEQYDLFPGNTLNNLLDMGEITHTVAKKDPMALHKILKEAGLEFGSGTEKQIIKRYGLDQVKTVDELMQAYDKYLREIAIPSKDLTYKIQDWWYNKTIKTLKGQELKDFKERFAKLNDPRRQ